MIAFLEMMRLKFQTCLLNVNPTTVKSKDKIITSKLIVYCKSSEVYAVKRSINEGLYEDILESAMRQGPKICS